MSHVIDAVIDIVLFGALGLGLLIGVAIACHTLVRHIKSLRARRETATMRARFAEIVANFDDSNINDH